jgi:hypothetical protein
MTKRQIIHILFIFVLIFFTYFLLLSQWHFTQFSDFLNYYQEALSYKHHQKLSSKFLFFQAPGHPVIMSLWMKLFNNESIQYLQWINIFQYSVIIIVVLWSYRILKTSYKSIGLFGLLINVSYVSLLGFLCAEFNFLFFFVLANYLFIRLISHTQMPFLKLNLLILFIGVSFGIAQYIRPLSLYYLLFFVSGILLVKYYFNKKPDTLLFPTSISLIKIFLIFIMTTFILYKLTLNQWRYQPSQNGLWSIFVGLNEESAGRYNAKDIQQFNKIGDKYHWQGDSLRYTLKDQIKLRIEKGLTFNLVNLPQRASHLLIPYYTSFWFFNKGNPNNKLWLPLMKFFFLISTLFAILSIVINGWYFVSFFLRGIQTNLEVFIFSSLWSIYLYLIIHVTILEIQPRYANHILFLNLWFLPFGLQNMNYSLKKLLGKNYLSGSQNL